nr:transposase [Streptomyces sasae]
MWNRIEPLLPADPVRGRRWADHRRTLEAVAWKYRTSSPWPGPARGARPFQTAHKRPARCPGPEVCSTPVPTVRETEPCRFSRRGSGVRGSAQVSWGGSGAPWVTIRPDTARVSDTYSRRSPVRSSGSPSTTAWGSSRTT